jgi:hypothetical protein
LWLDWDWDTGPPGVDFWFWLFWDFWDEWCEFFEVLLFWLVGSMGFMSKEFGGQVGFNGIGQESFFRFRRNLLNFEVWVWKNFYLGTWGAIFGCWSSFVF